MDFVASIQSTVAEVLFIITKREPHLVCFILSNLLLGFEICRCPSMRKVSHLVNVLRMHIRMQNIKYAPPKSSTQYRIEQSSSDGYQCVQMGVADVCIVSCAKLPNMLKINVHSVDVSSNIISYFNA